MYEFPIIASSADWCQPQLIRVSTIVQRSPNCMSGHRRSLAFILKGRQIYRKNESPFIVRVWSNHMGKGPVTHTITGGGPRVVVSTAAFHARARGSVTGLGGLKETKMFLPHPRVKVSIVGSLRDREVACSASGHQGTNFESCVWRTVSSQSSHHPQEVLLAQFSLYVHKDGLKPDSFHLHTITHVQRTKNEEFWSVRCDSLGVRQNSLMIWRQRLMNVIHFLCASTNAQKFMHAQKCERFSTCECRRQKNVRPAPV